MIFGTDTIVTAEEVKNGLYSKDTEFVDPEYQFKVGFVKGSKNNGKPYFRLYYSYEQYKKLFPESADRYEIIFGMRHYEESQWHKKWKNLFSSFCDIEHCTRNPETKKRKFADAFFEETSTCFEFQHSYIALDFEERNNFYKPRGMNVVWLYDLTKATVVQREDGFVDILEDNARGFFRISEHPANLRDVPVFIQVKDGTIYRVNDLMRRESNSGIESTIRYFNPTQVFSEQEFVDEIRNNKSIAQNQFLFTLYEVWNRNFKWILVEDATDKKIKMFNSDGEGHIFRNYHRKSLIQYKYATFSWGNDGKGHHFLNSQKDYSLGFGGENKRVWKFLCSDLSEC